MALQGLWDAVTALTGCCRSCRWQQSVKSSGLASNLQPSGAKADALREEMEEAANKVEICRVLGLFLPEGGLWAPGLWGKLQPLLSPCSTSFFPLCLC